LLPLLFIMCTQQEPTPVNLATFNIRYDNPADSLNAWPNRKEMVVKAIRDYDFDLFGMQEVLHRQLEFLEANLKDFERVGIGRLGGTEGEYAPIFFKKDRFEKIADSVIWLSETPTVVASVGWDAALPRIATWVKLKDKRTGKFLSVFNTHFDHIGVMARQESVKLMLTFVGSLREDIPTIIMGDFNIPEGDTPYQLLANKEQNSMGFTDSKYSSKSPHEGRMGTFNGFSDEVSRKEAIDFIFINERIATRTHATLEIREGPVFVSDHYPVMISADLK
jgi:endonuclease/exonuclease/phosphatase family metal-dependent hydrolase